MSYCAKNNIISNENYQLILKFIDIYSSANDKQLICKEGEKILKELNSSHISHAQPQAMRQSKSTASIYQTLQSAAPSSSAISEKSPPLYPAVTMLNTTEFAQQFPAVPSYIPFGLYADSQPSNTDNSNQKSKLQPIYKPMQ